MPELLKNYYNLALINKLAETLGSFYPALNTKDFINSVFNNEWESKELKQRMRHITHCLHHALPISYPKQIAILEKAAPHFNGFVAMFFPDFVEVYGLNDLATSVDALEHFTQYSSSEFAVRPFIIKYPNDMIKQHLIWSKHKNYHVRRLASEGIRPRLPWAIALPLFKKDPSPILPILNNLINDEQEYVRRSVANCLNDISKDHPQMVIDFINKWQNYSTNTNWILKHASRGLLKKGNEEVLKLFGIENNLNIRLYDFNIDKSILKIGDSFTFQFNIQLLENNDTKIRLEYNIYYMKANGKLSAKIFQIGTYVLNSNEVFKVNKKHAFINLTTRKHYTGTHKIAVVVNGKELGFLDFELVGV